MDRTPDDFASWYAAHHSGLVASLTVLGGDVSVAEDAAAEAFARALERWDRVGAMDSPVGWVHRVALNILRRRGRRAALEARLLRRVAPLTTVADAPAGEVWLLVADLPQRQRCAVVLRHVARLTEVEIAEAMGISRSTVSSTLRDAHRSLRTAIVLPDKELHHAR